MTSNFTAAELRDLADKLRLPLRNQDHVKTEDDASDALREYADLKESAEKGVTDEVVDAALDAYDRAGRDAPVSGMRAALRAAAPLLALMRDKGE